MRRIRKRISGVAAAAIVIGLAAIIALASTPERPDNESNLAVEVRKKLSTLPGCGVFDYLGFKVEGGTVTLHGQVVHSIIRRDAERSVGGIEGIDRVINKIEVLPVSESDDSIRLRSYRAIFRTRDLYRYSLGSAPSIRIIVRDGNVTLEGVVSNVTDSELAYAAATRVTNVLSVRSNLRLEERR